LASGCVLAFGKAFGKAGMRESFGMMHPPKGKRGHCEGGVKELEARRLWAVGVCLSFVSRGVGKGKGRLSWNSMGNVR